MGVPLVWTGGLIRESMIFEEVLNIAVHIQWDLFLLLIRFFCTLLICMHAFMQICQNMLLRGQSVG